MEYAILGVLAVAAFLFFGARWTARKNVDPVNISIAASLRLCAEGQMTEDQLVEHLESLFALYGIPLSRQSVARRLFFATTVIDTQMVSKKTKKAALALADEISNRF